MFQAPYFGGQPPQFQTSVPHVPNAGPRRDLQNSRHIQVEGPIPENGPPLGFRDEDVYTTIEKLVQASNIALYTPLSAHHNKTMDRFKQVQFHVEGLGRMLVSFREEANDRTDAILKAIQHSNEMQNARVALLINEMSALRKDVGRNSCDPSRSLSDRMASIEMDLQELSERIRDPEALRSSYEVGASPRAPESELPEKADGACPTHTSSAPSVPGTVDIQQSLLIPESPSRIDDNRILDEVDGLKLQSFGEEPIFRKEVLNPAHLRARFGPQPLSPSPSPLAPVGWSGDDSNSASIAGTPLSITQDIAVEDGTVAALRRAILGGKGAVASELTYQPAKCSTPFPNQVIPELPSPPITHVTPFDEEPAGPSRIATSSYPPAPEDRGISPASSLSALSSLTSLSESEGEDEVAEGATSAVRPAHNQPAPKKRGRPRKHRDVQPNSDGKPKTLGRPRKIRDGDGNPGDKKRGRKRRDSNGEALLPLKRRKHVDPAKAPVMTKERLHGAKNQVWPPVVSDDDDFQRKFIQCDNCDVSYHYGCVGIREGDPRLDPAEIFLCPPCASVSEGQRAWRRGACDEQLERHCGRKDCGQVLDDDEFFVERIIGRRWRLEGGGHLWLVKWDGYPVKEAQWLTEEDIGGLEKLVEEFEAAAHLRELAISGEETVLLKEAVDGGWTP